MNGSVNESKSMQINGKPFWEIRYELPRGEDGKRRQRKEMNFINKIKIKFMVFCVLSFVYTLSR